MAIPRRSTNYGLLMLTCPCGARLVGKVAPDKTTAAVALFEAHHTAPRCAPAWGLGDLETYAVDRTPRLTPQEVCASAPWLT